MVLFPSLSVIVLSLISTIFSLVELSLLTMFVCPHCCCCCLPFVWLLSLLPKFVNAVPKLLLKKITTRDSLLTYCLFFLSSSSSPLFVVLFLQVSFFDGCLFVCLIVCLFVCLKVMSVMFDKNCKLIQKIITLLNPTNRISFLLEYRNTAAMM